MFTAREPPSASRDRSSLPSAYWKRHLLTRRALFHSAPKDGPNAACWIAIPGARAIGVTEEILALDRKRVEDDGAGYLCDALPPTTRR